MAEALASLGVAASVAQFVTLSLKGAGFLWSVYSSSTGLTEEQDELRIISTGIKDSLEGLEKDASTISDGNLANIVTTATALSRDLGHELAHLQRLAEDKSVIGRARLLLRAARKKAAIGDLQRRLRELRDQITFQLVTLSHQSGNAFLSDAIGVKVTENTSEASRNIQQLHRQFQELQQSLDQLSDDERTNRLNALVPVTKAAVSRCQHWKLAENVLRSLHYKQISERRSEIKMAHSKTFSWSLSEEKSTLASWLKAENGIYWIKGKAGSGKSTLMKYLTTTKGLEVRPLLEEWARGEELFIASHFFWGPGTKLQCDINGLLRTLLFQILMEYPELIHVACPDRMSGDSFHYLESWTTEELRGSFVKLSEAQRLPAKMCLFIDGLDEFRGDLDGLIGLIQALSRSPNMKLCVSSRPWAEFRKNFGHLPWRLCVQDLTRRDIEMYVDDMLSRDDRFRALQNAMPHKAMYFKQEIANRADGVFLWVYLVTRNLLRGLTNDDDIPTLTRRLELFPSDLEDYFMAMLMSIDQTYHAETSAIFSMLQQSLSSQLSVDLVVAYLNMREIMEKLVSRWEKGFAQEGRLRYAREAVSAVGFALLSIDELEPHLSAVDAQRGSDAVSAMCRDLIDTWKVQNGGQDSFKVGFLHRSVADFLALPRTSAVLRSRFKGGTDGNIALCEAYLVMHRHRFSTSSGWDAPPSMGPSSANSDGWEPNEAKATFQADDAGPHPLVLLMLDLLQRAQVDVALEKDLLLLLLAGVVYSRGPETPTSLLTTDPNSTSRGSYRGLFGRMCGLWSYSSLTEKKFGARFLEVLEGLETRAFACSRFAVVENNLAWCLVRDSEIVMLDSSTESESRMGTPGLLHLDNVNISRLTEMLEHDWEKKTQTGRIAPSGPGEAIEDMPGPEIDITGPWAGFLYHELRALDSGKELVKNFADVCRLMVTFGAPRFIRRQEESESSFLPTGRGSAYGEFTDVSKMIWHMLSQQEQRLRGGFSSPEDVQALWPAEDDEKAAVAGSVGVWGLVRRGWGMLSQG